MKGSDGDPYVVWKRIAEDELIKPNPDPGILKAAMFAFGTKNSEEDIDLKARLKAEWLKRKYF